MVGGAGSRDGDGGVDGDDGGGGVDNGGGGGDDGGGGVDSDGGDGVGGGDDSSSIGLWMTLRPDHHPYHSYIRLQLPIYHTLMDFLTEI